MAHTVDPATLADAKKALRKTLLAARDAMSADARVRASAAIIERVCAHDAYRAANAVLTYMSFGSELDTHGFLARIFRDGKIAVLPRIDKATKSLALHVIADEHDLVDGVWGIREPRADAKTTGIAAIDMVLMPGLAFDVLGNRLGYGAGFYDRLLSSTTVRPIRVAAAFDFQLVESVPAGGEDRPCHWLVTETRVLKVKASA